MMDPVVKDIWVGVPVEVAFRRFTEEIRTWWPMISHSVSLENCRDVRFQLQAGTESGEPVRTLVEEDTVGIIHTWGTIAQWSPPDGFTMSWHPGRNPEEAQEIEISFRPDGEGTRVRLSHRGWEAIRERAEEVRSRYDEGWLRVLQLFAGTD